MSRQYQPLPKERFDSVLAEIKAARARELVERELREAEARGLALLNELERERRQPEFSI